MTMSGKSNSSIGILERSPVWELTRRLFQWWVHELLGLIPAELRSRMRGGTSRLVLQVSGNELALFQCDDDNQDLITRFRMEPALSEANEQALALLDTTLVKRSKLTLKLSRDRVLRKMLVLPRAAQRNIRQVLNYELDRQTPFRANQVYYDYQIATQVSGSGQLYVELTVVPRAFLDPLLDQIEKWGLRPSIVDVATSEEANSTAPSGMSQLNLIPPERALSDKSPGGWIIPTLITLVVILAITALAIPMIKARNVADGLERQVEVARKQAVEVTTLLDELDAHAADARFLVQKKLESPTVIAVLEEMSHILPDDTWLRRLEMRGKTVHIEGQSKTASALIGLIEESPLFINAAFQSPVTQDPRTGQERFKISADISIGV